MDVLIDAVYELSLDAYASAFEEHRNLRWIRPDPEREARVNRRRDVIVALETEHPRLKQRRNKAWRAANGLPEEP